MMGKDVQDLKPEDIVRVSMDLDVELAKHQGYYYGKPYEWVMDHFPWGVPGSGLEDQEGPDDWQASELRAYGDSIVERDFDGKHPVAPYRNAVASGHGIGKSALVSWLVLFIMSTRPHCKGIVTANTMPQLSTKTWSELAKWKRLCITGRWFKLSSGIGSLKMVHKDHPETWRVDGYTCAKENSDAFQGLHAATSTPFYFFDEASNIPEPIWEVSNGGLTDGEPAWFVYGNPTRNSGGFFGCFHGMRHRWRRTQVDSRSAKMSNKPLLKEWEDDYGDDSDFFRIRCRGVFPRIGEKQLISQEAVTLARRREAVCEIEDPLILGVDVAREPTGDQSVLCMRKGNDARTHPAEKYRGVDATFLAHRIEELHAKYRLDAIFVDSTGGYGQNVVDMLVRLGYNNVFGIKFGSQASKPKAYANKRSEMWIRMRDGINAGLAIEDDEYLERELITPTYDYNIRDALILEKKRDIKKRLGSGASPDYADALGLTYAKHVMKRANAGGVVRAGQGVKTQHDPWAPLGQPGG